MLDIEKFISELTKSAWVVERFDTRKDMQLLFNEPKERLKGIPDSLKDIILSYEIVSNSSDTAWFVTFSIMNTSSNNDGFSWNEFDNHSNEAAMSEEDRQNVKQFWEGHLCFLMSVKNSYSHISIVTKGNDAGKIVWGEEPEYEEVYELANSFDEFCVLLTNHLSGVTKNEVLDNFI